jgi:hypothetical protein
MKEIFAVKQAFYVLRYITAAADEGENVVLMCVCVCVFSFSKWNSRIEKVPTREFELCLCPALTVLESSDFFRAEQIRKLKKQLF